LESAIVIRVEGYDECALEQGGELTYGDLFSRFLDAQCKVLGLRQRGVQNECGIA